MNAARTVEGEAVWQLVLSLGGQIRAQILPGRGLIVTGYDMTAALAMADAAGIDRALALAVLPEVEAVMVRDMNKSQGGGDG